MGVSRRDGLEELLIVWLTGRRHIGHGAAMERVQGSDNLKGAVAVLGSVPAGQLHGPFVCLGPAVAEEHLVQGRVLDQYLCKLKLRDRVELIGSLEKRPRLLGDRVCNRLIGVPSVVHGPAGREIQVLLAIYVPYLRAVALYYDDGLTAHHKHVVLALNICPVGCHVIHLR